MATSSGNVGFTVLCLGLLAVFPGHESLSSSHRNRRSLFSLNDMLKIKTGYNGIDFLGYGNWCGVGGGGKPVDAIDRCCKHHDYCYEMAAESACNSENESAVYNVKYNWRLQSNEIVCDLDANDCSRTVCECDAKLAKCISLNLNSYDRANRHKLKAEDLVMQIKSILE